MRLLALVYSYDDGRAYQPEYLCCNTKMKEGTQERSYRVSGSLFTQSLSLTNVVKSLSGNSICRSEQSMIELRGDVLVGEFVV